MIALSHRLAKLPLSAFVAFSFATAICIYWSSLFGTPIFDDLHFIFQDQAVVGDSSYFTILTEFAWPLSLSVHKFFYGLWKQDFIYYHLLNLSLHLLNSFLLLKLALKLKLHFPKLMFLLFLIHPSNVIAVSWMVQLKTLLCFTFAMTSFLMLLRAVENKKWFLPSWISFLLSLFSKSASLPLCIVFIWFVFKKSGPKALVWVIPYLLMSLFSAYSILTSSQTSTATAQYESTTFVDAKIHQSQKPVIENNNSNQEIDKFQAIQDRLVLVLKTTHYYFWQVVLPLESYPIKGKPSKGLSFFEGFNAIFIVLLCVLNWGSIIASSLLVGLLMILPFLGFITAPFMNLTWVSEQHLYLALPFFLCFWLSLFSKWKFQLAPLVPFVFVVFCFIQSFKSAGYYKNEITFYSQSLLADPFNIPVVQNLAVSYLNINQPHEALAVTSKIIGEAETNKEVRQSKYFHYLLLLHVDILKQLNQ